MQIPSLRPTYIIGDVHGHLKKLVKLLQDAHLVDAEYAWKAGTATLWFMGDFVDRGPEMVKAGELSVIFMVFLLKTSTPSHY